MISIAIIDDEPKARDTIINILGMSAIELNIVGEASDVKSGYELIISKSPDLVLLDINMPDGSGFDLLKQFEKINFKVIFITAHEEYAVKAFKYSAIDYILKPIRAAELLQAVEKANDSFNKEETVLKISTLLSNLEKLKKIVLKTAESIHIINVKQIIRCQADVNYTTFFLEGGENLLVSKPLKEYDELLGQTGFFRTHQSHLVNLDHILRYDKTDGGYLVMNNKSMVPVSTRNKEELFRLFDTM
ncbi:MAG: response regulator transcription factor [Prolixibacteraceae bacterium]|jgi:two-component system, LytTR family, response regulator|nr:response regulator transcription factor [Prolixibacteraceae bacterium]MBT6765564.1 response regulator transcription factor [Prolixibacteraceae bacterium]MBT7000725.1 response regulator transcription factor [Prolixibacteraceae bacterium]MBT7395313.1 response regulator transcription factor [Prolixibacteraceae bacterium]